MPPFDDDDLPPPSLPRESISIVTWVLMGAALVLAFCIAVMFVRPLL
jgi:hypothetical protein